MRASGISRRGQRISQEVAAVDREPDRIAAADVEIAMSGEKGIRLVGWRIAKAIDVMMAVALGVDDPDQGAQREVLLHGEPRLTGQIFARDKKFVARRAPLGCTRGVDHGLVDALA